MIRVFLLSIEIFLNFSFSYAEKVKTIEVYGNERISSETIKIFLKSKLVII